MKKIEKQYFFYIPYLTVFFKGFSFIKVFTYKKYKEKSMLYMFILIL